MGIARFFITCYKLTPTESVDSDTLKTVVTFAEEEIKGYMGSGSNNIIRVADKDTIETVFKFYTKDLTITENDLVKYEGETYKIISEPKNTIHKNHHIKCKVRKVDDVKQQ